MRDKIVKYIKENRLFIGIIGVMVLLFVAFLWLTCGSGRTNQEQTTYTDLSKLTSQSSQEEESSSSSLSSSSSTPSQDVMVDVKGAVRQPGVYSLKAGARVTDAIAAAGGMTDVADSRSVNLAASLADEAVVYVATQEENISVIADKDASQGQGSNTAGGTGQNQGKINLNTASSEELQTISGIGAKRAEDIIAYRESHGGFQSVDDLKNVSGIGDKTLDKIRDSIYVG